mgnify:CR=1 FL=1
MLFSTLCLSDLDFSLTFWSLHFWPFYSLLQNGYYSAAVDEIISGNPIFLSLVFPVTPYQSFVFVHWITSLVFNVAVIMMKSTFNYIVEPWWWWWWSNLVIIITIHWVQCFYYDDIHCRLDIISFFFKISTFNFSGNFIFQLNQTLWMAVE